MHYLFNFRCTVAQVLRRLRCCPEEAGGSLDGVRVEEAGDGRGRPFLVAPFLVGVLAARCCWALARLLVVAFLLPAPSPAALGFLPLAPPLAAVGTLLFLCVRRLRTFSVL